MNFPKYLIIILGFIFIIFSGCTKNEKINTIPSPQIINKNKRIPISICRTSTHFTDKYTKPNTQDCIFIGNGIRNEKNQTFISVKHLFKDKNARYFAQLPKQKMFPLYDIYMHPKYDLVYKTNDNAGIPLSFHYPNIGEYVIIKIKNKKKEITTFTGKITNISDNILQTNLQLFPGSSGSPLFNTSGDLIGINIAINQTKKNTSYALILHKKMFLKKSF